MLEYGTICHILVRQPLRVSLWSPSDLLYRLNCHVDKQPAARDLFFVGLWIAGNSRRGEQIML